MVFRAMIPEDCGDRGEEISSLCAYRIAGQSHFRRSRKLARFEINLQIRK